mmetsp:Transcript_125887/g.350756  ORF Transcript_125887/g.350756 Transcript_125887/m.350756 type:complete len:229 (-) Transcript_125887:191-877(-)
MHREVQGAVGLQRAVKVQVDVADVGSTYCCDVHGAELPRPREYHTLVDTKDVMHPPQDAATYRQQLAGEVPAFGERAVAGRVHLVVVAWAQVDDGIADRGVGVLRLHGVEPEEAADRVGRALHLLYPRIRPVNGASCEQPAINRAYEARWHACNGPSALLEAAAEEVGERGKGLQRLANLIKAASAHSGKQPVERSPQGMWHVCLCQGPDAPRACTAEDHPQPEQTSQ